MTNCIYSRDGWCELNGEACDGNRIRCPEFGSSAFMGTDCMDYIPPNILTSEHGKKHWEGYYVGADPGEFEPDERNKDEVWVTEEEAIRND